MQKPIIDIEKSSTAVTYLAGLREAKKAGKGLGAVVMEIFRLSRGPGKLSPDDYFLYRLWDDRRYTAEAKRTFVSGAKPPSDCAWAAMSKDKPTLTAVLKSLDLPVPHTQAIVHPTRTFGGAVALRTRDDVRGFLRSGADYPIFGKPMDGVCSLGTAKISAYDAATDRVVLGDDQPVEIDAVIDIIENIGWRYLFQTLLCPHPGIVPMTGNQIGTVRMFVVADPEGCELVRAAWKIPVNNNADNFWRRGNVLAGIDVNTGMIVRAMQRTDAGAVPVETHPVNGLKFSEFQFPLWKEMRDTVLRAAVNITECPFQGWDVAMTDQGPVLVELEGDGGDPIMEQLCFDSGLLQGKYKQCVEAHPQVMQERLEKTKARLSKKRRDSFAQLWNKPANIRSEAMVGAGR